MTGVPVLVARRRTSGTAVRSAGGGQVAASASQCGPAVTGGALAERDGEKIASEVGENRSASESGSACESGSASGRRRRRDSENDRRVELSGCGEMRGLCWAIRTRWIKSEPFDSLGSSFAS
jgi:hypothetical protein